MLWPGPVPGTEKLKLFESLTVKWKPTPGDRETEGGFVEMVASELISGMAGFEQAGGRMGGRGRWELRAEGKA